MNLQAMGVQEVGGCVRVRLILGGDLMLRFLQTASEPRVNLLCSILLVETGTVQAVQGSHLKLVH